MLVNAYGDAKFSLDRIVKAIATFERTMISTESPFDAFNKGDKRLVDCVDRQKPHTHAREH